MMKLVPLLNGLTCALMVGDVENILWLIEESVTIEMELEEK